MTTARDNGTTGDNVVQGIEFKKHPPQDYDSADTKKLLGMIFHGMADDAHIATFCSADGQPAYPKPIDGTITKIDRTSIPYAFYYGTSSLYPHPDGNIYNRKSQFAALHVVVLDDIGTKISADSLPEELIPNYIIESSKGNYQYGFILSEPLTDIALADALIHLVYTSGVSDAGGKITTKAVRLPAGVNCKKGTDKFLDPVTLVSCNDDFWTPTELLDVLNVGTTWEQVLEDPSKAAHTSNRGVRSLSPWAAVPIAAEAASGVVDSMLEYLYSEDMVVHDTSADWITIKCPWHDTHTTGADTAGYSPLGRGGPEFQNQRGFKCMHGHCADRKTSDFLQHMAEIGAEELPVYDDAAYLVRDYVYDEINNVAVRVANCVAPYAVPIIGFRNSNNTKTTVYTHEGKSKRVPLSSIWETARHRVIVSGSSYDPANPEVITTDRNGTKRLNTFVEPPWGEGAYDQKDVDMFLDIAHYLIPIEEEFDYFMGWLAAKVSERTFKGNAILMVATTQGIGRSMFSDLIADMFTRSNCTKVTFPTMVKNDGFNEWASNLMVFCDEVMTDRKALYSSYETMKDLLDPRPKEMTINRKYGNKTSDINYASYLLLSNHSAAVGQLRGDRRIYVVSNPRVRKTPEYYSNVEAWRDTIDSDGKPAWIKSVWRWLRQQPYDLTELSKPAPLTVGKRDMQDETDSVEEVIIQWCFDNIARALPNRPIFELAEAACDVAGVPLTVLDNFKSAFTRMTLAARSFKDLKRVDGKPVRLRVSSNAVACGEFPDLTPNNADSVNTAMDKAAVSVDRVCTDSAKRQEAVASLAEAISNAV